MPPAEIIAIPLPLKMQIPEPPQLVTVSSVIQQTVSLIFLEPFGRARFHRVLSRDYPLTRFGDGVVEQFLADGHGWPRAHAVHGRSACHQGAEPVAEIQQDGWCGVDDFHRPSTNRINDITGHTQRRQSLVDDLLTRHFV